MVVVSFAINSLLMEGFSVQSSFRVILFAKNGIQERCILSHEEVDGVFYLFILVSQYQEIVKIIREVKPDLFLLSHLLPEITGLHLYDLLHAMQRLEDVPALLLCEKKLDEEMTQKIAQRQIQVLMEPYVLSELLDRIDAICTLS